MSFLSLSRCLARSHGINMMRASKLSLPSSHEPVLTVNNVLLASSQSWTKQPCCGMSSVSVPPAKIGKAASSDEQIEFLSLFPDVVRDLSMDSEHDDIPDAQKWFSKVLQYNVRGGKMNRGLAVGMSYKLLAEPSSITPGTLRQAHILGWCVELLQSYFLVTDDIIDGSQVRRGRPAWHAKDGRGLAAFNDGVLLNAGVYKMLKKHFRNEQYYTDILDLFHWATLKTALGQTLDLLSNESGSGKPQLELFTMDRYDAIVRYKTGYYSFYLPVALGMHMAGISQSDHVRVAGITDTELHRQARTILLEMGSFYQVQDDYLDCFGDVSVTGKVGTDILEGKCTWLAVVALQRANAQQRAVMEEHYGSGSEQSIEIITSLYKELGLPATYRHYEESTSALIRMHVQQISRGLNHKVFFKFLDKIHKRSS